MRIAVASSGLGHVARGIETWAADTAQALAERGIDVTLFAGGQVSGVGCQVSGGERGEGQEAGGRREGEGREQRTDDGRDDEQKDAKEAKGGMDDRGRQTVPFPSVPSLLKPETRNLNSAPLRILVLPCFRRGERAARRLARWTPGFAWRWALKAPYGWEQISFWRHLWPHLRRGGFDILHVQDPMLAYWCRLFRKLGLVKTKEILAHGTEESIEFLAKFEYVQHLAPWHLDQALRKLGDLKEGRKAKGEGE